MFEVVENGKKLNLESLSNFPDCPEVKAEKKESLSNLDCYALRFAAMHFIDKNFSDDFLTDLKGLDESNAFQDKELYINNFEGFPINESEDIRTLYLTEEGRIIASVYNNESDSYTDYLID